MIYCIVLEHTWSRKKSTQSPLKWVVQLKNLSTVPGKITREIKSKNIASTKLIATYNIKTNSETRTNISGSNS